MALSPLVATTSQVYAGTSQKKGDTVTDIALSKGSTEDQTTDEGDKETASARILSPDPSAGCSTADRRVCIPCDLGLPGADCIPQKDWPPSPTFPQGPITEKSIIKSKGEMGISQLIKSLASSDSAKSAKALRTLCDEASKGTSATVTASDCSILDTPEGQVQVGIIDDVIGGLIIYGIIKLIEDSDDPTNISGCEWLYGDDGIIGDLPAAKLRCEESAA